MKAGLTSVGDSPKGMVRRRHHLVVVGTTFGVVISVAMALVAGTYLLLASTIEEGTGGDRSGWAKGTRSDFAAIGSILLGSAILLFVLTLRLHGWRRWARAVLATMFGALGVVLISIATATASPEWIFVAAPSFFCALVCLSLAEVDHD